MNIKAKVRIKIQQMDIDILSNQILLDSIDYLFWFIQIKMLVLKDLRLEDIIDQIIMLSSTEKNFYDQPIDSDIKRFEEIRKLTTGQVEDYTTGCLLYSNYTKNCYRLKTFYLSRQK